MAAYFEKRRGLFAAVSTIPVGSSHPRLYDPTYLPFSRREILKAFAGDGKAFRSFCEKPAFTQFEIFNETFLLQLASDIVNTPTSFHASPEHPLVVLDLESGAGRLARFLQDILNLLKPGCFRVKATDSFKWSYEINPVFPVEKIDHVAALEKHNPTFVIVSFMAPNVDLTAAIRQTPSVEQYFLIGPGQHDLGYCGEAWETWGQRSEANHTGEKPPYQVDGFGMIEMNFRSLQLCCEDDAIVGRFNLQEYDEEPENRAYDSHSSVFCFRRERAPDWVYQRTALGNLDLA